jgi:hypothetical protein
MNIETACLKGEPIYAVERPPLSYLPEDFRIQCEASASFAELERSLKKVYAQIDGSIELSQKGKAEAYRRALSMFWDFAEWSLPAEGGEQFGAKINRRR